MWHNQSAQKKADKNQDNNKKESWEIELAIITDCINNKLKKSKNMVI